MEQILEVLSGYADLEQIYAVITKIIISFIVSVIIGVQRKNHQQVIGIRTLLLICISSTLLGVLSEYAALYTPGGKGDPGRIAASVVTGIGFVGGGAIMHRGLNVKGVTTAALIWAMSAIGLSIGYGLYLQSILVFILIVVSLPFFQKFEAKYFPIDKMRVLTLTYDEGKIDFEKVKDLIREKGLILQDLSIHENVKEGVQELVLHVFASNEVDLFGLNENLKKTGKLTRFSFTDV
ncbi:MAG: MgtC/SapB family protein [Treponema sp.]|nr:MgtC/SapB family protein [Candidatus Treponema scatequi]